MRDNELKLEDVKDSHTLGGEGERDSCTGDLRRGKWIRDGQM